MKNILENLFNYKRLSEQEAKEVLTRLTKGEFNPSQVASFLTVFNLRRPSLAEIKGFRAALLELAIPIHLGVETIDLCGTGGDGQDTFNISTLSSFVVAGAGFKVSKHGNYSASSVSGSSNMLEYFGYKFSREESQLRKELDQANICFLHGPLFHPAMKLVAPIRKELKVKTFFNILGPLVNPAKPKYQISGVYNLETARMYHQILSETDKQYTVLHSLDVYDEISLTADTKYYSNSGEGLFKSQDFGFKNISKKDIKGGKSVEENASIFLNVLKNECPLAHKQVVVANSSIAIHTITKKPLNQCVAIALDSIESGKALATFNKLISISK